MLAETDSRQPWVTLGLTSLTSVFVGIWIGSALGSGAKDSVTASNPKQGSLKIPIIARGNPTKDPLANSLYTSPGEAEPVSTEEKKTAEASIGATPNTTKLPEDPSKINARREPAAPPIIARLPSVDTPGPLLGDIQPFRPNPDQATVNPSDTRAAESAIRSIVSSAKGTVIEASDRDGGRAFIVKLAPKRVLEVTDRITNRIPQLLSVSEVTNRSRLPASERKEDSYAEILRLENSMIDLRKQLLQAQIDFLPNAPAIREVEEDIAKTQKKISQLSASQSNASYLEIRLKSS